MTVSEQELFDQLKENLNKVVDLLIEKVSNQGKTLRIHKDGTIHVLMDHSPRKVFREKSVPSYYIDEINKYHLTDEMVYMGLKLRLQIERDEEIRKNSTKVEMEDLLFDSLHGGVF